MKSKLIYTAILVYFATHPGTAFGESDLCDTPGKPIGACTTLSINYDIAANYRISTTYTNCKTGKSVTKPADYSECSNRQRSDKFHDWGTYTFKDVLVGSELKMGPKWTYTDNYNATDAKAKPGNNKFFCSGSIGTSSAKCEAQ